MPRRFSILPLALLAACQQPAEVRLDAGSRPNVLVIVADDLGYLDLGVFGSEIRTPNIDALASSGLVMTNFYASPLCATSRAMLLTGADHHQVGMGSQTDPSRYPEQSEYYQGFLPHRGVTIATRLQQLGYHTYMAGKWHLGERDDQTPADHGFEHSYVLLEGGASHWGDMKGLTRDSLAKYREDGKLVESLPEDFYSTVFYTDKMIDYVDRSLEDGKPFFGYLAYTAPHWPHQALSEDIAAQRGRYDEGYDVLRQRRFAKWKELGYGDKDMVLPPDPPDLVPWDELTDEEKLRSSRTMEVYAAMVERLDAEIGRLIAHLKRKGVYDNTVIVFMSDNGAEGGSPAPPGFDYAIENIGKPNSFPSLGPGWAEAASAQFYLRKTFTAEGGIRVPAMISAPALGLRAGRTDGLTSVVDLAPTFVELAGGENSPRGTASLKMSGLSLAPMLRGDAAAVRKKDAALSWEVQGARAIRRWPWKAEWMFPPFGTGEWRLYNLADDPTQRRDVAAANPKVLQEMVDAWEEYARENGVIKLTAPIPVRSDFAPRAPSGK